MILGEMAALPVRVSLMGPHCGMIVRHSQSRYSYKQSSQVETGEYMSRPQAVVNSEVANACKELERVSWRRESIALIDVEPSRGSRAAA